MFTINCPHCEKEQTFEADELPTHSSDDLEVECTECNQSFKVGWYAEIEYR